MHHSGRPVGTYECTLSPHAAMPCAYSACLCLLQCVCVCVCVQVLMVLDLTNSRRYYDFYREIPQERGIMYCKVRTVTAHITYCTARRTASV